MTRYVRHEAADEYGLPLIGSAKPRIRKGMGGMHEARCTCGWRICRRYRAVVERKLRDHLDAARSEAVS